VAIAFAEIEELRWMGDFSRQLVGKLHPEVHFVHVRHGDADHEAGLEDEFRQLARRPDFPTQTFVFASLPQARVVPSLVSYVNDHRIDLLVIGGKQRNFLERIFTPGHLRPLLDRTEVPLLVIPAG
jgi:nucleotide-binding universal stress UspA family protein